VKAGELRERIVIQRQGEPTDNGIETVSGALETYCERRAKWKAAGPGEVFENLGREAKASGTFWVRFDTKTAGILPTDKLIWKRSVGDRKFDIVGAEETGHREEVQIVVTADDEG
jgi:hypothetical protein